MNPYQPATPELWETPPDWQTRAACAAHDPHLWDDVDSTDRNDGTGAQRIRTAIAICEPCPVRNECLALVLDIRKLDKASWPCGVWAGRYWRDGEPAPPPTLDKRQPPSTPCAAGHCDDCGRRVAGFNRGDRLTSGMCNTCYRRAHRARLRAKA